MKGWKGVETIFGVKEVSLAGAANDFLGGLPLFLGRVGVAEVKGVAGATGITGVTVVTGVAGVTGVTGVTGIRTPFVLV